RAENHNVRRARVARKAGAVHAEEEAAADAGDRRSRRWATHMSAKARTNRTDDARRPVPRIVAMLSTALVGATAFLTFSAAVAGQAGKQRTFASADEAVRALIDTVKKGDLDGLMAIFGPDAQDVVNSSDPATGRKNREVFTVATPERWRLTDDAPNK